MHEDFDFFEDLDEDATPAAPPRYARQAIFDDFQRVRWSSDLDEISELMDRVGRSANTISKQISNYTIPELREPWQTKEWLPGAVRARDAYRRMHKRLTARLNVVQAEKAAQIREAAHIAGLRRIHARRDLYLRQSRLKILLKVLSIKASSRSDREISRRMLNVIRERGLIDPQVLGDLRRELEVEDRPLTVREKSTGEALARYRQKLNDVERQIAEHHQSEEAGDADQ